MTEEDELISMSSSQHELPNEKTSLLNTAKSTVSKIIGTNIPNDEVLKLNPFEKFTKYRTLPILQILDILLILSVIILVKKKKKIKFNKTKQCLKGNVLYRTKKFLLSSYWNFNK